MSHYSNEKKKEIQMSEAFITSVFLALSGGFQDAYTYFTRDGVFSNAQTGNVVLMSQHFMMHEWMQGLRYLVPILAFAGGVFVADCIQGKYKYASRIHWRQGILLLEILILLLVGFLPKDQNMLATVLVSFSCAMQVQTFRKVGGYRKSAKWYSCFFRLPEGKTSGADEAGTLLLWNYFLLCNRSRYRRKSFHASWIPCHLDFRWDSGGQLPADVCGEGEVANIKSHFKRRSGTHLKYKSGFVWLAHAAGR